MTTTEKTQYIETVGRRKTSVARTRITPATKNSITINGKDLETYFVTKELQTTALESLHAAKTEAKFKISVVAKGGGIRKGEQVH
jgi:small subunit ribosomal protein S9